MECHVIKMRAFKIRDLISIWAISHERECWYTELAQVWCGRRLCRRRCGIAFLQPFCKFYPGRVDSNKKKEIVTCLVKHLLGSSNANNSTNRPDWPLVIRAPTGKSAAVAKIRLFLFILNECLSATAAAGVTVASDNYCPRLLRIRDLSLELTPVQIRHTLCLTAAASHVSRQSDRHQRKCCANASAQLSVAAWVLIC